MTLFHTAPPLTTPRLRLRSFTPEDSAQLHAILSDPETLRYWRTGPDSSPEVSLQRIHQILSAWREQGHGYWAVEMGGTLIGNCGFGSNSEAPETSLGFVLDRSLWGKGLATEAALAVLHFGFESMNLNAVIGITHPENLGTRRVLEKCDLRFGEDILRKGNPRVLYKITRDAWNSRPEALSR